MAVLRWFHSTVAGMAALASLVGCARQSPVPLRPEPIPYADTLPIEQPGEREELEVFLLMQEALSGEVSKGISIRRLVNKEHEALNVTRFDDVVNSAWFEHRIGGSGLSPGEVFKGPTTDAGPDTTGPIILTQAKLEGISPGFHIEDQRGVRYVVKFDPKGFQSLSSAAGVIANRLMYAAGYHVPEDYLFRFRREHITGVADGATYLDEDFEEHPLTLDLVDEILSRVDTLPGGLFLAVASQYVPGPPLGPFYFFGTRDDDPNDWYVHEHRRDLRGLYVVASWMNHVDMRFANTMDAFVEPGYVKHYLIDFAASLGSGTVRPHYPREGAEYHFDFWPTMARVFTLGFYRVGWENEQFATIDPSIGWMQAETFDPGSWKPNWPNDAFVNMTVRDAYWGAKLVGSFTDEQIRAAVEAGELPNVVATDTLTAILRYRRNRIVQHWYAQVTPLEHPQIESARTDNSDPGFVISFDDYGLLHGAWTPDGVSYTWEFRHPALDRHWNGVAPAGVGYRQRLAIGPLESISEASQYGELTPQQSLATLEITAEGHATMKGRPAIVHLAWDSDTKQYTVVGLEH